jgi:hypothetical protein
MKRILVMTAGLVALGLSAFSHAPAAAPASQELYGEIKRMDATLSDAFDSHDINKLKLLFTEDLEFYQDNEGLVRYEQTVRDFEGLFAQGNNMRRKLVEGSLEVYPIKDYGAIEMGAHQFCHLENRKDECGTFRFVHLWRKGDGAWKISRVVSYAPLGSSNRSRPLESAESDLPAPRYQRPHHRSARSGHSVAVPFAFRMRRASQSSMHLTLIPG